MWGKRQTKSQKGVQGEIYYATHYHLIPLYVICGLLIVVTLVMGCFVRFIWQNQQTGVWQQTGANIIAANNDRFLAATAEPADKKQYIYPVNIRFMTIDPYQQLRYTYDPGASASTNTATVGITTSDLLKAAGQPLQNLGPRNFNIVNQLQECSRLYVIRFQPGSTQYGGFTPFITVKLKDNRTAYVYKNTSCINDQMDGAQLVSDLETTIRSIESY
jgi:hypothetical protein